MHIYLYVCMYVAVMEIIVAINTTYIFTYVAYMIKTTTDFPS